MTRAEYSPDTIIVLMVAARWRYSRSRDGLSMSILTSDTYIARVLKNNQEAFSTEQQ
jgi:hypothetical protein